MVSEMTTPFGLLDGILVGWDSNREIIDVDYTGVLRDNSYIGLYFSAKWCPPCQLFTPKLIKFYNSVNGRHKSLEIIFVSADLDQEAFLDYYGSMPWLAISCQHEAVTSKLREKYDVHGFPKFVLLNTTENVLSNSARANVLDDPNGERFPWQ